MKPYVLGAIFARGGSERIPRKNLQLLDGIPLLGHAIMQAKEVKGIDRLIVSTDDQEIAEVARAYGAEVPFIRPKRLATSRSPEILSWKHAIEYVQKDIKRPVDILLSIPTTSPLRDPKDVERCLKKLKKSSADMVVTVTECSYNPYYNVLKQDARGYISVVCKSKKLIIRSQDAPKVYMLSPVAYASRAAYILKTKDERLGKIAAVRVSYENAADIDSMLDLEWCEFILKRRKNKS